MKTLQAEVSEDSIPESLGGKFALWNEPYDFDLSVSGPLYFDGLLPETPSGLQKKMSVLPQPSSQEPSAHDLHHDRLRTVKCRRWSLEEEDKLAQMRLNLESELAEVPPYPDVVGDRRLLRFLRGHNMDVTKATHMFRNFLKYRKEHNVDSIRDRICKYHWSIPLLLTRRCSEGKPKHSV